MKKPSILSASEQLAEYLKEQIDTKKWIDFMPGESLLMSQLQIGRETVRAAMLRLEKEGILEPSGRGKRRKIIKVNSSKPSKKIRVRLLAYEKEDRGRMDCASLVADLLAAGIDADFTGKSLKELGMELSRVTRYVRLNPADAWIICAASREIIEWFSQQATPAIAMYGSQAGLPIAGPIRKCYQARRQPYVV